MMKAKRETDFVLPRTCKRPRSSLCHLKNHNWDNLQRPRRSVSSSIEAAQCKQEAIRSVDHDEDLDEIALALLEMSSPCIQGRSYGRSRSPVVSQNAPRMGRPLSDGSPSALHLKSNTLKAVPTIIITSGSSTDTAHAEAKSALSELQDGVSSKGQSGSPSSNQGSETVAYVLSQDSARILDPCLPQPLNLATREGNPGQGFEPDVATNLYTEADQQGFATLKMGHTVSTGISLPSITHMANKQVRQDTTPRTDRRSTSLPSSGQISHSSQKHEAHAQLALQQLLHSRLAGKCQGDRPIANTRGGKLIVVPDPSPRVGPSPMSQLKVEGSTPARTHSPSGFPGSHREAKPLTLSRVPTLVLSAAHKPATTPRPSNPLKAAPSLGNAAVKSKHEAIVPSGSGKLETLRTERHRSQPLPGGLAADRRVPEGSKTGACMQRNGSPSGDESSEEDWLPNWSLNLYSALNPTVITTGQTFLTGRSASQNLDGKPPNLVR